MWLRVQLRNIIRVCRFCTLDIFASEIGELRNLVSKHFLNRLGGEDAALGERGNAIVKQRRNYLDVIRWASETTCAGAVIDRGNFVGGDEERAAVGVVAGSCLWTLGCLGLLVHVRQLGTHLGSREHGDVVEVEGTEDVRLEVLV